ncbi:MAG: hypothetical protein EOO61_08580 [Hymenobacter sp.]|nr:MAG: hypothetical protein EOO61_08580 [Hymenobacter sp.]
MTAFFAVFFFVLLLVVCSLAVVRVIDPVEPSPRSRVVMRMLVMVLAATVGVIIWAVWEMR